MSYDQLRTAYDRASNLGVGVRQFRAERLRAIKSGVGLPRLSTAPYLVLHLIPYVALEGRVSLNIADLILKPEDYTYDFLDDEKKVPNLEGYHQTYAPLVEREGHEQAEKLLVAFWQVFRSGQLECVRDLVYKQGGAHTMVGKDVSELIRRYIIRQIGVSKGHGMRGPAAIALSFLNIQDVPFQNRRRCSEGLEREQLDFPEQFIDDLGRVEDVDAIVRPLLDMVWQAFGVARCPYYNEAGDWVLE